MKKALYNGTIHTGDEILTNHVVIVADGKVEAVTHTLPSDMPLIDLQKQHLSAGSIDIQINGGEKWYFTQHPTAETIQDIYESSLKYGTTHVLPCMISASKDTILQGIEAVRQYRDKYQNGVFGMHLEGPFLNPLKRGAHSSQQVRKPTTAELEEILRYGKDVIKVMTIAPECFTPEQLEMLLESEIILSAGHSTMTYLEAQWCFSKGIHLVTHLYNAMTQMGHREPGLVGAVLENNAVYAPIILDGAHCDYAVARIAHQMKKDKLFLITDATFLGRKVQHFQWENFDAFLDGEWYRNSEGNLAGACISMEEAIRNAIQHMGLSVDEAVKMGTTRVAQALKMGAQLGKIKPGYPACFMQFNADFSEVKSLIL